MAGRRETTDEELLLAAARLRHKMAVDRETLATLGRASELLFAGEVGIGSATVLLGIACAASDWTPAQTTFLAMALAGLVGTTLVMGRANKVRARMRDLLLESSRDGNRVATLEAVAGR